MIFSSGVQVTATRSARGRGLVCVLLWGLCAWLGMSATDAASAQQSRAAETARAPASTTSPAGAEPSAETRAAARDAYARGQAAFAQEKYAEAKSAFEQAHALVPNPIVLLSTAECEVRLGNIEQAHALLARYLGDRPDAPDRAEVEHKAAQLRERPGLLMLTSEPRGAAIAIDGKPVDAQTPAALYVPPGEHHVALTLPGHEPAGESVQARMGARHGLRLVLKPSATAPQVVHTQPAASPDDGPGAAVWVTGIVGGLGVATGVVLGTLALDEQDQFDQMPSLASADRGEKLALFADIAFGVGAASLITAAVLYASGDDARERAAGAGIQVAPALVRGGAGLVGAGRF